MPVSSVDEGHETSRTSLLYPPSAYIGVYWHDVLGQFEVSFFVEKSVLNDNSCLRYLLHLSRMDSIHWLAHLTYILEHPFPPKKTFRFYISSISFSLSNLIRLIGDLPLPWFHLSICNIPI